MADDNRLLETSLKDLVIRIDEIKQEFHRGSSATDGDMIIYDSTAFKEWYHDLKCTLQTMSMYYDNRELYEAEITTSIKYNGWCDKEKFLDLEQKLNALIEVFPLHKNEKGEGKTLVKDKIFVVHGHDNEAKEIVARVIEKLGYIPIILHEQANAGMTIIEKIEAYSKDVVFSIVLYTECDVGRDKKEPEEKNNYRARQNVVFEHGYLVGKFGRDRVFALKKGDVETPGDISGIVYSVMDEGGAWKLSLIKDMKAVNLYASADLL